MFQNFKEGHWRLLKPEILEDFLEIMLANSYLREAQASNYLVFTDPYILGVFLELNVVKLCLTVSLKWKYFPLYQISSSESSVFLLLCCWSPIWKRYLGASFWLNLKHWNKWPWKKHMLDPKFSGHKKHSVNRAIGGKNRGIYPTVNLY